LLAGPSGCGEGRTCCAAIKLAAKRQTPVSIRLNSTPLYPQGGAKMGDSELARMGAQNRHGISAFRALAAILSVIGQYYRKPDSPCRSAYKKEVPPRGGHGALLRQGRPAGQGPIMYPARPVPWQKQR